MNRIILQIACLLALPFNLLGQAEELNSLTAKLREQVVAVQAASKSYEPEINVLQPGVLRYGYDEVDQKGNHTAFAYEFNLADIDPYAVREQTQKDIIYVVLAVRNKQKLVKAYKNEEVQAYDQEVSIVAKDIEHARAISELVKKAIPHAEKVTANRLQLSGYEAMTAWLADHIKDVPLGTKTIAQSLAATARPGSVVLTQTESDAKGAATETQFTFNLADVNVNTINFKISGNKFAINFETLRKNKYVQATKDGEVKPFVNEVTIHTNNVDEARDLKTVLTMAAPLAVEKVKTGMPAPATEKEALEKIKSLTTDVEDGDKKISQAFEPLCLTRFTQVETDPRKTDKSVFGFNWMDINPAASVIDVTGDKMFVRVLTDNKKKLMTRTVNDVFAGYDEEVKIYMPGIEQARRLKFAIDNTIEKCRASYKKPYSEDAASASAWLLTAIKDVTLEDVTMKQALEPAEPGNNDKLKFTSREINAKGSGAEEVYEFNLSDLNALSIETDVKGKWLYVTIETKGKNKIIKAYKDGKIQPYAYKLSFALNDVEASRNVADALRLILK